MAAVLDIAADPFADVFGARRGNGQPIAAFERAAREIQRMLGGLYNSEACQRIDTALANLAAGGPRFIGEDIIRVRVRDGGAFGETVSTFGLDVPTALECADTVNIDLRAVASIAARCTSSLPTRVPGTPQRTWVLHAPDPLAATTQLLVYLAENEF